MAKVIDNLRNLKIDDKVDKPYLEGVMKIAIENLNNNLSTKLELSNEEEWNIRRERNPIKKDALLNEKLRITIPIHNKVNENYNNSYCTIIFNEQKYAYKVYYGLENEFDSFPNLELENQSFKETYSRHKKSLRNIDYNILNSFGAYYETYKAEKKFDYKHLDFYLKTIFDNYCNILNESGIKYRICYKNERFNENSSPVYKKIIIETNDGKPFLGIKINIRRSQRLINFQFMNDYYITVQFDKIDMDEIQNNIVVVRNHFNLQAKQRTLNLVEDDVLFANRNPLRYNNRFHLVMLDNYKNPNYYFFIATQKGLIKLNSHIITDGIKSVLHHYIFNLLFKEVGIEAEKDDFFENLSGYLDMYSLIKY